MRITALYIAVALMAIGLFVPRQWAHADVGDNARIEVGVRDFSDTSDFYRPIGPLEELNMKGKGFAREGYAALLLGILAALSCAGISVVARRRRIEAGLRAGFFATQVASLIATLVFANRLAGFGYLTLGWSPLLCAVSAVLGAGTAFVLRGAPAR